MDILMVADLLSKKSTNRIYKQFTETQWFSESEMETYKTEKLKKLVAHCYKNVPYYTRIMNELDIIPSDIKTVADLHRFPILTKVIIKENYQDFMPINYKYYPGIKHGQTGGTTGNSLLKRSDALTRSNTWAAYRRFCDWMGVRYNDWNILLKGMHVLKPTYMEHIKQKVYEALRRTIPINAYLGCDMNAQSVIGAFEKHNISLVRGYSQAIFETAKLLNSLNVSLEARAVSTTAEPLFPEYRPIISKAFGAPLFDQYGCGEIGSIAFECNHHEGLHVSEERVCVEVNEKNEILITDLDNHVMPFIRYWNGDEIELSKEMCSCGRQTKLIKSIVGRTSDYLYGVNGVNVHWGYIFHLLWDSKMALRRNFKKFQLVQVSSDELIFRHVSDELTPKDMDLIVKTTIDKLGDMKVRFVREIDIENSKSGKYRWVENRLITK